MPLAELLAGCPLEGSHFEQLKGLVRFGFDHGGIAAVQALAYRVGRIDFGRTSIPVIDIAEGNVCARCRAPWMASVTNPDVSSWTDDEESRGASLCSEDCKVRPWWCPKCDGSQVPRHSKWCRHAAGGEG